MRLSAVIRTKNSSQTLKKCLESLKNQLVAPDELVIVDSGSTDKTLEIANQFGCKIVYYPSNIEFNYSKALNIGIESVSSEYILIISSHIQLKYLNTTEHMLSFLAAWNQICAVSTTRDSVETHFEFLEAEQVNWTLVNRQNFQGQGMYNFCSLIRKNDWQDYPFNELIPRCEDQDWVLHFYKKKNAGSIIIEHPSVFYENPYYNAKKDAWDYIVLGHYIYHYYISKKFVRKMLIEGVENLFKGRIDIAIHHMVIVYYIILDRLRGTQIQSIYNQSLNTETQKF